MNLEEKRPPDITLAGLSIWTNARQFPDSQDYWDGNWLNVIVRVAASGARVEAQGSIIRIDELVAFHDELAALHRDLSGEAELACMEPELGVKVTCSPLGHVEAVVQITPDHMTQQHRFEFSVDQSYLPETIGGLAKVIASFPIIGAP